MHVRKAAPHTGTTQHGLMAYHTAYSTYCMHVYPPGPSNGLDSKCLDLEPEKHHLRHHLQKTPPTASKCSRGVVWCVSEANSKCIFHKQQALFLPLPSHSQTYILPYMYLPVTPCP